MAEANSPSLKEHSDLSLSPHTTPDSSINTGTTDHQNDLQVYGVCLKDLYSTHIFTKSLWPPTAYPTIFNLALIKSEKVVRGEIDNAFVRLTIRGNVDDILRRKVPIQVNEIFKHVDPGARRIALIEGASGIGKTALSVYFCQQWKNGKLFQEYEVAILVRLGDPLVQKAEKIEEILPFEDEPMRNGLAEKIREIDGEGVLWIMDGWNELPPDFSNDTIVYQLAWCNSLLRKSSVIVTTRPTVSDIPRGAASTRIEVVGFTPTNQRQYYTECFNGDTTAVDTFLQKLHENVAVEESCACYLPLNAAITVQLYRTGSGTLPTTVHSFYASAVQSCLSRFIQEQPGKSNAETTFDLLGGLPRVLQKPFHVLCQLAFSGVMNNKVTFTSSDLSALKAPDNVCDLGLLQAVPSIISESKPLYYRFTHKPMQQFLAAVHMSRMNASEQIALFDMFLTVLNHSKFSSVLQFYAGITKLSTTRSILKLVPRALRPVPGGILDIVRKFCRQEGSMAANLYKPLLISLIRCLYEAQDASLCKFVAVELEGGLSLGHTSLTPYNCLSIGYFLSAVCTTIDSKLFAVYLRNSCIDDYSCKCLVSGLNLCPISNKEKITQLTLYLDGANITENGFSQIADVLRSTTILCELYCQLRIGGLQLIDALATNTSLIKLDFSYTAIEISEENGPALTQMLQSNKTLRELRLRHNQCRPDSRALFIAEGLKENKVLTLLDLSNSGLKADGASALSSALTINSALETLYIGCNRLFDTGIAHIADALRVNNSLKELFLESSDITDEGVRSLSLALKDNKTLMKLNLRANTAITDSGLQVLRDSLKINTGLVRLNIPSHLVSSIAAMEEEINEERMRNVVPGIKVQCKYTVCDFYITVSVILYGKINTAY